MGEAFPGIVHPCKIYNILAIGSPFLYIGPRESHIAEIASSLTDPQRASCVRHGQVDEVVKSICERADRFLDNRGRTRFADSSVSTIPQLINQIELKPSDANTAVADRASGLELARVRSPTVREGLLAK
jgi:hypothetical protein